MWPYYNGLQPYFDAIQTSDDVTNGKPFESWNDRVHNGTASVRGGLEDWRARAKSGSARG